MSLETYENINVPLWNALKHIGGARVLDVGCGTGALGELLEQNGNVVEGITHSKAEARIAAGRIHCVHVLNLDHLEESGFPIQGEFDVILFADVLEHLMDPRKTLMTICNYLKRDGRVFVSLPNVACFYVRFGLLFGRFDMSPTGGILDDTHRHFYTRKTARDFLTRCGLEIDRTDYVPGGSVWAYQLLKKSPQKGSSSQRQSGSRKDSSLFNFYCRWLFPTERAVTACWPGMLANQFVFHGRCRASEAND